MDSCIEELAHLIHQRSKAAADNIYSASGGSNKSDLLLSFRQVEAKAAGILQVLNDYRADHPELYKEPAADVAHRLRGQVETFKAELISARQELARYKERERVCGWDNT